MGELTIREMEQDDDFAAWYSELIEQEEEAAGRSGGPVERYLMLSNEIGDWIGGLRYWLRGGVAHLVDVVVLPQERHRGHAHRLLTAFEERAVDGGAHLAEFWTDDERSGGPAGGPGLGPGVPAGELHRSADAGPSWRSGSRLQAELAPTVGVHRTSRTILQGWSGLHFGGLTVVLGNTWVLSPTPRANSNPKSKS